MTNTNFKIILFNGGFAGDLITSLYNPDIFLKFSNRRILLDNQVLKLKSYEYRKTHSYEQKINYLKSIEHIGVCSSHDDELALRLKANTTLVHCSDKALAEVFYNRIKRDKPDQKMTLEENMKWQDVNKRVFKKQIDLAKITDSNFLETLGIKDSRSVKILNKWIDLQELNND